MTQILPILSMPIARFGFTPSLFGSIEKAFQAIMPNQWKHAKSMEGLKTKLEPSLYFKETEVYVLQCIYN